jgi:hypothetical protein
VKTIGDFNDSAAGGSQFLFLLVECYSTKKVEARLLS